MNRLIFIYAWIAGWFSICLLNLVQPFMQIWMGRNMLFSFPIVIMMCIYFYSLTMGDVRSQYSSAAGLFWESRNYVVVEVVLNLFLNYFMGKYFGVFGIVIATTISIVFVNFLWGSRVVFKYYFVSYRINDFYKMHFTYVLVTAVVAMLTFYVSSLVSYEGILSFLAKTVIVIILPNFLYYVFYFKSRIFKESTSLIKSIGKHKKS